MKSIKNNIKIDEINNDAENNMFGIEDRHFPICYKILRYSGFWRPTIFKKALKTYYNIYTVYSLSNIVLMLITIIINSIISDNSIYLLIQNLFLIIAIFNALIKLSNLNIRRSNILSILKNITDVPWNRLDDNGEIKIIKHSAKVETTVSAFCLLTVILTFISYSVKPILYPNSDHALLVDAYPLCDRNSRLCFWLSYLHQLTGYFSTLLLQVGYDTSIYNIIERVSSLLLVLEYRFLKLPYLVEANTLGYSEEINYVKKCIKDHHSICKAIKEINDTFYETVFIQFISSISALCTNIYLLSMQELFSSEFNSVFLFLVCVYSQNFFFCWYGYKVSINSLHVSDSLFNMNWCILRKESKHMLIFVMLKTSEPIYLFSRSIVKLSPESFVNIVKVSYSAFNILQHTSKKNL